MIYTTKIYKPVDGCGCGLLEEVTSLTLKGYEEHTSSVLAFLNYVAGQEQTKNMTPNQLVDNIISNNIIVETT